MVRVNASAFFTVEFEISLLLADFIVCALSESTFPNCTLVCLLVHWVLYKRLAKYGGPEMNFNAIAGGSFSVIL